jgi:hypothetical protein
MRQGHILGPLFLKPSFIGTYATCESVVKLGIRPNPTFRLTTQAVMGATPWWSKLEPQLGKYFHLKVHLERHVTFPTLEMSTH